MNDVCLDTLRVHDGGSVGSGTVHAGDLCGFWDTNSQGVTNMTSTGNKATLHVETDATAAYRGFEIIVVAYTMGNLTANTRHLYNICTALCKCSANVLCLLGCCSDFLPKKHEVWTNVELMLGQSRRRWANIKSTLVQRPVFAGYCLVAFQC